MPDLYSDGLTNVIGSSIYQRVCAWVHIARDYGVLYIYQRVCAWVHMARDYGVLYSIISFVVPIPLLSVDPLAIAIILVYYPCLPAPSQVLPTNRLYVDQICENIGTPPDPFFFFFFSTLSYQKVLRCHFFARFWRLAPIFFFQLVTCDVYRLPIRLPAKSALTWPVV